MQEYKHLHWSTFVPGLAIVGLEAGYLYMYKAGWNVSTGQPTILYTAVKCVMAFDDG